LIDVFILVVYYENDQVVLMSNVQAKL